MPLDPKLRPLLLEFAREEGPELCAALETAVLQLKERAGDAALDAWSRASRTLHTIRGSGAMLDLVGLDQLARGLQGLLAPHRASGERLPDSECEAVLETAQLMRGLLAAIAAGGAQPMTPDSAVSPVSPGHFGPSH